MSKPVISASSTVSASQSQVSTELGGEAVILGVDLGQYFGLNEVGARVWSLVQSPKLVSDVCAAIMDEYEVTRGECEADVLELLEEMRDKGLIDVHGGPQNP